MCLRRSATFPKPGRNWIGCRHEAMETARNERITRNSSERGAWWQVRPAVVRIRFSCTPSQQKESTQLFQHRKMWYYAGFKVGGVFALFYLAPDNPFSFLNRLTCTAVTVTWTNTMVFEILHILISRIAVVICMRVLVQGGYYCSRELAQNSSYLPASVRLGEGIIASSYV